MIKSEVNNKKWEIILDNQEKRYSCYYSEGNKHSLCPHQDNCILNESVAKIYSEIDENKIKIKNLKQIYDIATDLHKQENIPYNKTFNGFEPKKNILERKILEKKNKENYKKLKEITTKKGGYL